MPVSSVSKITADYARTQITPTKTVAESVGSKEFSNTCCGWATFAAQVLPDPIALWHSHKQDENQAHDHYDRGEDYYNWFLGPMMIYTSGVISSAVKRETLEDMQQRKLKTVVHKVDLKPGEKMLDIGCGWGSLSVHAAKAGASATGVTLTRNQTQAALMWGLLMAKYVFPGADASMPLNWVLEQVERAGFEVQSTETLGLHYSTAIFRWCQNWMSNKGKIVAKYGVRWFRIWEFFLAYSTIIARQGSATVYQIVLHKNTNTFGHSQFIKCHLHLPK
ncbi:hypothetical protein HK105_209432 [Polyrhizophydium stewartii]|uniref:sphingolipid C(9)-methyltransferase n=1 Tax=Polyrhizophydium stewartii TaxID=2732419 RepID=A0ABR4MV24_9FUNG